MKWLVAWAVTVLVLVSQSDARPPVPAPVYKAVRATPWQRTQRIQAFDIIYCESRYSVYASNNGTYLGLFQFGPWARSRYGFGWTARAQALAAYRYWRDSGWSGWECQPGGV